MEGRQTFQKCERIVSRKLMEQLFEGRSSHVLTVFPLKAIFMTTARTFGEPPVKVLISVSKRRFKHAVDRNRVKRQVREAYRLNKQQLWARVPDGLTLQVAFIWLTDEQLESRRVAHRVSLMLHKLSNHSCLQS